MTITTKSLEQKIEFAVEQLVREHLAACEAAAAVAVRAAFGRASTASSKSSKSSKSTPGKPARAPAPRRSREELADLAERLYAAIRRHPGETMAKIGPVVGAGSRALEQPMERLRRDGRVRSVGSRRYTRYFPMGE